MAVTLKDVAKEAGVSIATVSKVLRGKQGEIAISEATRRRVLEAAKRLNYHPNIAARRLASRRSNTVGIVIEAYDSFGGPVNAQILRGIGSELDKARLDALLISRESARDIVSSLKAMVAGKKVDALILWVQEIDAALCEELQKIGAPHCHVGFRGSSNCATVLSDNFNGAYHATRHLIQQGHEDIAIIAPERYAEAVERLHGYRKALEDNGIPFNPEMVVRGEYTSSGDVSALDVEHFRRILPKCSAVFATSDLLAMLVKEVARADGYRLGEDKALVGFDGTEVGRHLDPPLTSVAQDGFEMGRQAVASILAQLDGDQSPAQEVVVPTRLVVRKSSLVAPDLGRR